MSLQQFVASSRGAHSPHLRSLFRALSKIELSEQSIEKALAYVGKNEGTYPDEDLIKQRINECSSHLPISIPGDLEKLVGAFPKLILNESGPRYLLQIRMFFVSYENDTKNSSQSLPIPRNKLRAKIKVQQFIQTAKSSDDKVFVDCFRLSPEDALSILTTEPKIMKCQPYELKLIHEFLLADLKYTLEETKKFPQIYLLNYFELKNRAKYLKYNNIAQFDRDKPRYISIKILSREKTDKFLEALGDSHNIKTYCDFLKTM
ncbi:MAG: hypothetical protein MHPSP_001171 [Paramarteilia canceri]